MFPFTDIHVCYIPKLIANGLAVPEKKAENMNDAGQEHNKRSSISYSGDLTLHSKKENILENDKYEYSNSLNKIYF